MSVMLWFVVLLALLGVSIVGVKSFRRWRNGPWQVDLQVGKSATLHCSGEVITLRLEKIPDRLVLRGTHREPEKWMTERFSISLASEEGRDQVKFFPPKDWPIERTRCVGWLQVVDPGRVRVWLIKEGE